MWPRIVGISQPLCAAFQLIDHIESFVEPLVREITVTVQLSESMHNK